MTNEKRERLEDDLRNLTKVIIDLIILFRKKLGIFYGEVHLNDRHK